MDLKQLLALNTIGTKPVSVEDVHGCRNMRVIAIDKDKARDLYSRSAARIFVRINKNLHEIISNSRIYDVDDLRYYTCSGAAQENDIKISDLM